MDNATETATRAPRPLEDPYLVGEQAAAEARRERLRRENGDDILIREDRQWDWLLGMLISLSIDNDSSTYTTHSANGDLGAAREELGQVPTRGQRAQPEAQSPP